MADLSDVRTIAIVGAGIMGSGITEAALLGRFEKVVLNDIDSDSLKKGQDTISSMIRTLADEEGLKRFVTSYMGMNRLHNPDLDKLRRDPAHVGVIAEGQTADEILERLVCEQDLQEAVSDADFVIEAVSEVLELKQEVFRQLSELTPAHTVCASNTSTLPVSKIALKSKRPENVIGMHFHGYTQVHNRLVEIMGSDKTAEDAMELGRLVGASMPSLGGPRLAVRLDKEAAGFIANRIAAPAGLYRAWFMNQAREQGITLEQLHAAGQDMRGTDIVGLDTAYNASVSYQQNLSPDFVPSQMIADLVKQGRLGKKTGRGIYEWDESGNAIIKKVEVEEKTRVINEVERIGEGHEATFAIGMDKYKEWAEKLEEIAEKIGKSYLKPCEMMRSGRFKDYP